MAEERIQKIMAEQGLCSRRAAEQIIAEGRVKVNGHPVKVGDKMDPNRDVLHVDDERIYIRKDQQMYYLALYKPRGYVTTASDELGRKTVMELVSAIPARRPTGYRRAGISLTSSITVLRPSSSLAVVT